MNRLEQNRWIVRMVRANLFTFLGMASLCTAAVAQTLKVADEENLIGTWAGRYSGVSSGAFEITISRDHEGKLGGSSWSKADDGEASTWIVTTIELADGTVTIRSSDLSGDVELTTESTLEGSSIKGTYVARALADGSEIEGGTFTGTKKPTKDGW